MTMPRHPAEPGETVFESVGVTLIEVSDTDGTLTEGPPIPLTGRELLRLMRERIKYYGSPLPEGFVPPPGIDVDALLKEIPWPPPPAGPPTA